MAEKNVLGGDLAPCGLDPMTGWLSDGSCRTGVELHSRRERNRAGSWSRVLLLDRSA